MAAGFMEAFELGMNRLRQLLDYVSFASNLATPCYQNAEGFRFTSYHRGRTLTAIAEPEWAYVRDTLRNNRYWLRGFTPHRFGPPFAVEADDPILQPHKLFEKMFQEDPDSL